MIDVHPYPILLMISAPSGTGKTTLCKRLVQEFTGLRYSVSCTTRPKRGEEVDGESYHFMSVEQFEKLIAEDAFLEYAKVYGHWYGTLKETVLSNMRDGFDVIMDIDIQGADSIRRVVQDSEDLLKNGFVDVFVIPPCVETLRKRLKGRGENSDEDLETRIAASEHEIQEYRKYTYIVVNDDLDDAYRVLSSIYLGEKSRIGRLRDGCDGDSL